MLHVYRLVMLICGALSATVAGAQQPDSTLPPGFKPVNQVVSSMLGGNWLHVGGQDAPNQATRDARCAMHLADPDNLDGLWDSGSDKDRSYKAWHRSYPALGEQRGQLGFIKHGGKVIAAMSTGFAWDAFQFDQILSRAQRGDFVLVFKESRFDWDKSEAKWVKRRARQSHRGLVTGVGKFVTLENGTRTVALQFPRDADGKPIPLRTQNFLRCGSFTPGE